MLIPLLPAMPGTPAAGPAAPLPVLGALPPAPSLLTRFTSFIKQNKIELLTIAAAVLLGSAGTALTFVGLPLIAVAPLGVAIIVCLTHFAIMAYSYLIYQDPYAIYQHWNSLFWN